MKIIIGFLFLMTFSIESQAIDSKQSLKIGRIEMSAFEISQETQEDSSELNLFVFVGGNEQGRLKIGRIEMRGFEAYQETQEDSEKDNLFVLIDGNGLLKIGRIEMSAFEVYQETQEDVSDDKIAITPDEIVIMPDKIAITIDDSEKTEDFGFYYYYFNEKNIDEGVINHEQQQEDHSLKNRLKLTGYLKKGAEHDVRGRRGLGRALVVGRAWDFCSFRYSDIPTFCNRYYKIESRIGIFKNKKEDSHIYLLARLEAPLHIKYRFNNEISLSFFNEIIFRRGRVESTYWSLFTGVRLLVEQNLDVHVGITKRKNDTKALFGVLPKKDTIFNVFLEMSF